MWFYSKALPDGRWGIYEGNNLLATISCPQACQEIITTLQQRQLLNTSSNHPTDTVDGHCMNRLERSSIFHFYKLQMWDNGHLIGRESKRERENLV